MTSPSILVRLAIVAGASAPFGAAAETSLDAFATVSPYAFFYTLTTDFGAEEHPVLELGLGADLGWRVSRFTEVGLGLRYDVGPGTEHTAHFFRIPMTIRAALPLSKKGHELRFGIGGGLGASLVGGFTGDLEGDDRYLHSVGLVFEAFTGLAFPIQEGLVWFVHLGVVADAQEAQNGEGYRHDDGFINVQLPFFRGGATWL